jgi:hypothetical protein
VLLWSAALQVGCRGRKRTPELPIISLRCRCAAVHYSHADRMRDTEQAEGSERLRERSAPSSRGGERDKHGGVGSCTLKPGSRRTDLCERG